METDNSSWGLESTDDIFEGTSLHKRASKRTVFETNIGWIVNGETKLGDAYPTYTVTLPAGEGKRKYECSCYGHGQGHIRRKKMCSHVLSVILYRKSGKKQLLPDSEPQRIEDTYPSKDALEPNSPEMAAARRTYNAAARREAVRGGEGSGRFKSVAAATLPDDAIDMDDPMLGMPPLPDKFTEFRPSQWEAILEIMEHLEGGKKVVMLSAPTGSGKTLIGETVRRLTAGSSVYCCTTKSLQDQIQREFDYARTIKGKANYPTQYRPDLNGDDCTKTQNSDCDWCDEFATCPYRIAKNEAVFAPLPILNTSYFLGETTNREASQFRQRDLVVIDEADTLEEQLMGHIEVVIGSYLRKSIGVYSLPSKTVPSDWVKWLENEIIPGIKQLKAKLYSNDVKVRRQKKRLDLLLDRIKPLITEYGDGKRMIEDGWVMTGYEGKAKDATIRFKPVTVDLYTNDVLWERGNQFLLMSATLISPAQMAKDLGLEEGEWAVVNLDSTFPVERRPVFVPGNISMTAKTKDTAYPKMAAAVEEIVVENPGVRILVHTVSYALTKYLIDNIKSTRTMSYQSSEDRERVLANFLNVDDAVLLAPSFERGIDLPAENCQVIVIAKVPYPYLGDKQISARMYAKGGNVWYAVQTIRAIVQMTGRGMRSRDDWCDTYILDSQFKRLYRDNQRMFPKWWREALVMSVTDPKNRPMIDAARERKENRRQTMR